MKRIIKTKSLINFCGECNNQVNLHKYIQVDEEQTFKEAWDMRNENSDDEIYNRKKFLGFCPCGNIFILNRSLKRRYYENSKAI